MTTVNPETETDAEVILADGNELTLASGLKVKVERLKTRGTLALLRILTKGAEDIFRSGLDVNAADFQQQLVLHVLFAIPSAPEETISFLRVMVTPAQLRTDIRSKGDQKWNEDQWNQLDVELFDPEIEDLIDITAKIVEAEAPHLQALGKKIAALIPTISRSLQTNSSEETTPKRSSKRGSRASTPTTS